MECLPFPTLPPLWLSIAHFDAKETSGRLSFLHCKLRLKRIPNKFANWESKRLGHVDFCGFLVNNVSNIQSDPFPKSVRSTKGNCFRITGHFEAKLSLIKNQRKTTKKQQKTTKNKKKH